MTIPLSFATMAVMSTIIYFFGFDTNDVVGAALISGGFVLIIEGAF